MTSPACQQAMDNVGSGVGAALRAVDCASSEMAQSGFSRISDTLGPAITILFTLFIALFGLALITGRSRISLSALTPRMVTLVLVLTFATSWLAFQSVFWNFAILTPDWIASKLMGTQGSATNVFADKIDIVMGALVDASGDNAMGDSTSMFSPPGMMWLGGTLLLLGTVGVLATSKIALAVLLALGPLFIVMALFGGTRGLFVGWLKGVVMLSVAPLFAVLAGSLMLELAVPVIVALGQVPGKIDPRAAMALFMIGAVHVALMTMVIRVAGTMVGGWTVFGLARSTNADEGGALPVAARAARAMAAAQPRADMARTPSLAPTRQIRVPASAPLAANDTDAGAATHSRTTRIVTGGAAAAPERERSQISRARGIGSRFRASSHTGLGSSASRSMETRP